MELNDPWLDTRDRTSFQFLLWRYTGDNTIIKIGYTNLEKIYLNSLE